ncbi:MAG: prolipoprotein diacylglyceryl transferase [Proteobacteria bacterium]|nr:prolipoprotein diacylglyceryl transferase [Pseudomonadota bacterium]
MYPDLLSIFGIELFGPGFERVVLGALSALMIWGIVNSIQIFREGKRSEGGIQGIIVTAILIWAITRFGSTFDPGYALLFSQPIVIHSYAFCILIGVCLGIGTAMWMAKKRGSNPYDIAKLCILLTLLGFLGARAAHVIVDASTYWNACFNPTAIGATQSDCLRFLNFAEGGLTFYGGVIAGMLVLIWYFVSRHRKGTPANPLSTMDKLAAALSITHVFGRIGCLAAGCCWGAITTGKIGLHYPPGSFAYHELAKDPAMLEIMTQTGETPLLHATQLYEAGGELVIYGILWAMLLKNAKPGKMAACWLLSYGALRFVIEFMRDDFERGYYFEQIIEPINRLFHVAPDHPTILSTSQGIAFVMMALGIGTLIWSHLANKSARPPKSDTQNAQTSPQIEKSATPMANATSQNAPSEPSQPESNDASSKESPSSDNNSQTGNNNLSDLDTLHSESAEIDDTTLENTHINPDNKDTSAKDSDTTAPNHDTNPKNVDTDLANDSENNNQQN